MGARTDPAKTEDPTYECVDCDTHVEGPVDSRECPNCGGYLRNIAVPRE